MKRLKQSFSEKLLSTTSKCETVQSSNSVREYADTIPVDLLIDILSLVPAKSIARFRSLSKFWAFIFSRHDFTELFLTKSSTRSRLLFTLEADDKLFFYSTSQPHNPDDISSLVATPYKSFPNYVLSDISTPVCGLVLLDGWRRNLPAICNPATGELLTLPEVLLKENNLLASNPDTEVKEEIAAMYIGYDPMGKEFKVLCMTCSRVRDNTHRVLTLGPRKRFWRPVEGKFRFVENCVISNEICINGVLYFGAKVRSGVAKIVCFDVRLEKFSFIKTNKDMRNSSYVNSLNLFNYKGRLGIYRSEDSRGIVFWVKEDAENHKWSKHMYEPSPLGNNMIRYCSFVGMTGTGEFVWSSLYRGPPNSLYLTFYNFESETFTKVKVNIQGTDDFTHIYIKTLYTDYVENVKWLM